MLRMFTALVIALTLAMGPAANQLLAKGKGGGGGRGGGGRGGASRGGHHGGSKGGHAAKGGSKATGGHAAPAAAATGNKGLACKVTCAMAGAGVASVCGKVAHPAGKLACVVAVAGATAYCSHRCSPGK